MKPSRYNHFFEIENNYSIAYNAFSNACAIIENRKLEEFFDFIKYKSEIELSFLQNLQKGSFLIEDNIDELELVRYNLYKSRFSTSTLNLTIIPTLDCNFNCVYCFEKKVHICEYMNKDIQKQIVKFVNNHADHISAFNVIWYGGEPLLALEIMESLSLSFIRICSENKIIYSASLITNGFLLTRDVLTKLQKIKINTIQVTIDGGPEDHNVKRPLIGGGKTFEKILYNLSNGIDLLPRVLIRINIDVNNQDAGNIVMNYIKQYGLIDKIEVYLGCIRDDNNCYDKNVCLDEKTFAKLEFAFVSSIKPNSIVMYPRNKFSFCCADNVNSLVVGSDGSLYKCWSEVGNINKSVGNIKNTENKVNKKILDYIMFDPTYKDPCKDCDILPICMGGCPFQRDSKTSMQCSKYRFILEKCLKNAIKVYKRNVKEVI